MAGGWTQVKPILIRSTYSDSWQLVWGNLALLYYGPKRRLMISIWGRLFRLWGRKGY